MRKKALIALRVAIALLLGGVGTGAGAADEELNALLKRIFLQEPQVSFVGLRVNQTQMGERTLSVREKFYYRPSGWERIEIQSPPWLEGFWMVRTEKVEARYVPSRKTLYLSPSPPPEVLHRERERRWRLVCQNFQIERTGEENIAGRLAWILEVRSRHRSGALVHKLWVDKEHSLVLRKEAYTADGRLHSVMYFTEVQIRPVEESLFDPKPPEGAQAVERPREEIFPHPGALPPSLRPLFLFPQKLPPGYTLERLEVRKSPSPESPSPDQRLVLRFTDGLQSLIVSIALAPPEVREKALREFQQRAPSQAALRVVENRLVFAFSPYLSRKELEEVLESLRPGGGRPPFDRHWRRHGPP